MGISFGDFVPVIGDVIDAIVGISSANDMMDFQREMSSTAYQRTMADMEAAGLNPLLASKVGGAVSGAGTMYQSNIGRGVNTALAARRLRSEVKVLDEDARKKLSERELADMQGALTGMNFEIARQNLSTAKAQAAEARIEEAFWNSDAGKALKIARMVGASVPSMPSLKPRPSTGKGARR